MDFVARTLVSYQHWFFYPIMAVGRVNLYIMSLKYLLLEPDKALYRKTELAAYANCDASLPLPFPLLLPLLD